MTQPTEPWLIIGGEGRLGGALQKRLTAEGTEFVAIGRSEQDLSTPVDFSALANRLQWPKFGVVANCAGFTDVDGAERSAGLANRLNAEVVAEIASYCKLTNSRLIQISTNYVFDGRQRRPYLVTDSPNPLQEYGRSKLRGEDAVRTAVSHEARAAIVRTGWLYGSHATREALPERLAHKLLNNQPIHLTENLGAPTWAADVAHYLVKLNELPDAEFTAVHHAMALGSISWYEFGMRIASDLGVSDELVRRKDAEDVGGAARPANGLLESTAVAGYAIPDWLNGWQRYLPEFLEGLGR